MPSKDFALSKRFYQDLGFDLAWSSENLAWKFELPLAELSTRKHTDNFKMHLLVENVAAWWGHVRDQGLAAKYGVRVESPSDKPWGIRDFAILDPSGVARRIGQNIDEADRKIT